MAPRKAGRGPECGRSSLRAALAPPPAGIVTRMGRRRSCSDDIGVDRVRDSECQSPTPGPKGGPTADGVSAKWQLVPVSISISATCWSEWQDLNLQPPRPEQDASEYHRTPMTERFHGLAIRNWPRANGTGVGFLTTARRRSFASSAQ